MARALRTSASSKLLLGRPCSLLLCSFASTEVSVHTRPFERASPVPGVLEQRSLIFATLGSGDAEFLATIGTNDQDIAARETRVLADRAAAATRGSIAATRCRQLVHLEPPRPPVYGTCVQSWPFMLDSQVVLGMNGKQQVGSRDDDSRTHAQLLVNLDLVRRDNVPVIRRFSGGGTVVVGAGTIVATLIANKDDAPCEPFPRESTQITARTPSTGPIMGWTEELRVFDFGVHADPR